MGPTFAEVNKSQGIHTAEKKDEINILNDAQHNSVCSRDWPGPHYSKYGT